MSEVANAQDLAPEKRSSKHWTNIFLCSKRILMEVVQVRMKITNGLGLRGQVDL